MNILTTNLFHFLGGVKFAITLITATAFLVIIGTLLESKNNSHLSAAAYIYDSPIFSALLWGFFINILFAALRRWPFKKRHIPFLITHWGLLMILGGMLVKHYYGTQGSMYLMEGSASDQLMVANTRAIHLEQRGIDSAVVTPLDRPQGTAMDLKFKVLKTFPNSSSRFETFIKDDYVVVNEIPPFPLDKPIHTQLDGMDWVLLGKKTEHIEKEFRQFYINHASIALTNDETTINLPLSEALSHPILFEDKIVHLSLNVEEDLDFSFKIIELSVNFGHQTAKISLLEREPFIYQSGDSLMGGIGIQLDVNATPSLLFLQNEHEDIFLFAIGPHGDIATKIYRPESLTSLYSYDQGFGGYSMQSTLSLPKHPRIFEQEIILNKLTEQLKDPSIKVNELTPPLQLLQQACLQVNLSFAEIVVDYLKTWADQGGWLFTKNQKSLNTNLTSVFQAINWTLIPSNVFKGCIWASEMINRIENHAATSKEVLKILNTYQWPFIKKLEDHPFSNKKSFILDSLNQYLFAAAEELPFVNGLDHKDPLSNAFIFSAYCRAYHIHLAHILENLSVNQEIFELNLECPLTTKFKIERLLDKIEDNTPLVLMEIQKGSIKERIALRYDRNAQGMKWPIFGGRYLIRFQPHMMSLPYEVHIRRAKQLSYPNSSQPHKFESDLFVKNKQTNEVVETTISMNQVHETHEGYRLYLASLTPNDESNVKRVQLVVNHDPGKYCLLYPGAIILVIGMLTLLLQYKRIPG